MLVLQRGSNVPQLQRTRPRDAAEFVAFQIERATKSSDLSHGRDNAKLLQQA